MAHMAAWSASCSREAKCAIVILAPLIVKLVSGPPTELAAQLVVVVLPLDPEPSPLLLASADIARRWKKSCHVILKHARSTAKPVHGEISKVAPSLAALASGIVIAKSSNLPLMAVAIALSCLALDSASLAIAQSTASSRNGLNSALAQRHAAQEAKLALAWSTLARTLVVLHARLLKMCALATLNHARSTVM
jgi:hypothetical protein